MEMVYVLATPEELAVELGERVRLSRIARSLSQEDLAAASQTSIQAIETLESSGQAELITFLRVAHALSLSSALMEAFQPIPRSLDEVERMETAKMKTRRANEESEGR